MLRFSGHTPPTPTMKQFEMRLQTNSRDLKELNPLFEKAFDLIQQDLCKITLESYHVSPEEIPELIEKEMWGKRGNPDFAVLEWGWK